MKKTKKTPSRKKTFNVQRPTSNVQWGGRASEEGGLYGADAGLGLGNHAHEKPKFDLEDRLLEFSARLITLVDALPVSRAGNHVACQLLRCGTSPFANHGEVQAAESRKDFVHKLGVCLKELREVRRWLRLIARVDLLPVQRISTLLLESEELIRIFSASIRTAEKNAS
jgi:four helix bundle protein